MTKRSPSVAVYDQYWSTGGGGERYAAAIGAAIAGQAGVGRVELIGPEPIDLAGLSERFHLDLSRVETRVIDPSLGAVTDASADYDMFINATHLSSAPSLAPESYYVVYFPTRPDVGFTGWRRRLATGFGPLVAGTDVRSVAGLHPPDPLRRHLVRWTDGNYRFRVDPGVSEVRVTLGRYLPTQVGPVEVSFDVGGRTIAHTTLAPVAHPADRRRTKVVHLELPTTDESTEVAVRSSTHVPSQLGPTGDNRSLGVPVLTVRAGRSWQAALSARTPLLGSLRDPDTSQPEFLRSYRLIAISDYVQDWIRQFWQADSEILYPPAAIHAPGAKTNTILSVGRFFPPGHGHCKRQLEMVEAFARLCDRGLSGWQLHLVGGLAEVGRAYLDEIERAAQGHPVTIHVDASGAELGDLYRSASIYWHAAGLGEDPATNPERFEHFGITVVEAMGAGAVPVVVGTGGPAEIVTDGEDGVHFSDLDGLVTATEALVADPELRARLGSAAHRRALDFGDDAFARAARNLVGSLQPTTA